MKDLIKLLEDGKVGEFSRALHRARVEEAIREARAPLARLEAALKYAEVSYPKHKGKAYKRKEEWMGITEHTALLQNLYNHYETSWEQRIQILDVLLGKKGEEALILPPITCDFGRFVFMEKKSFINAGVTILDWSPVYIGEGSLIGANTAIYGVGHPMSPKEREDDFYILSTGTINIGKYVWVGGGCKILGPVNIGDGAVIGMGAIITKDVEPGDIVVGNNKVIGNVFEKDSENIVKEIKGE